MSKLQKMIEDKYGTVYKFVKATGIPQSYTYAMIKGTANPSTEKIKQIAAYLDTTPEVVFDAILDTRPGNDRSESKDKQDNDDRNEGSQ